MADVFDDPIVRDLERMGYPEEAEPRCPVCGRICETIYTYDGVEIAGCDMCLIAKDACDCPQCYPEKAKEEI